MLSWQQRIDLAKETIQCGWLFRRTKPRGFAIDDEILAHDWMTCSCGMLDARVPRNWVNNDGDPNAGQPLDAELQMLGIKFYDAVCNNEVERAEIIYHKVQDKAAILIEQIESGSTSDNQIATEKILATEQL
jgi:hypothetical protein